MSRWRASSRRCCSSRPSRSRSTSSPTRCGVEGGRGREALRRAARARARGPRRRAARARGRLDARLAPRRRGGRAAAARRAPRTPALTPAQAETLSIVAYLQPVSRPEVARIRGVAAESAASALAERGLIEEAGRSQFGAVLYRTTPLFLKLFGLQSVDELPDPAQWDPSPEEQAALRDRLLRAGEERGGVASLATCAASCPQAASMSRPRVKPHRRAQAVLLQHAALNAAIAPREEPS